MFQPVREGSGIAVPVILIDVQLDCDLLTVSLRHATEQAVEVAEGHNFRCGPDGQRLAVVRVEVCNEGLARDSLVPFLLPHPQFVVAFLPSAARGAVWSIRVSLLRRQPSSIQHCSVVVRERASPPEKMPNPEPHSHFDLRQRVKYFAPQPFIKTVDLENLVESGTSVSYTHLTLPTNREV